MSASEGRGAGLGRDVLLWALSGAVVGAGAGLADGLVLTRLIRSVTLPRYVVLMSALQYAMLGGGASLLLGGLSRVPPLRRLRGHPFAVLVPAALFVLLVTLGNRFYLPGEVEPASLAFDGLLLALALLVALFLARAGARRRPLSPGKALAWRSLLLLLLIGGAGAASREPPPRGERAAGRAAEGPNLILLLIDTLRNDHVGWAGYERSTTPNLERIAREGTIFTHLVTQAPHTKASCATLLTSLYPAAHTAVGNDGLPRSARTLAEVLAAAGYRTFGVSANTFITRVFGFDQGFERLVTLPLITTTKNEVGYFLQRIRRRFGRLAPAERLRDLLVAFEQRWFWDVRPDASELSAPEVIEPFLRWLGEARDREPFFAYLHFLEPHSPYAPPPPYDAEFGGPYAGDPVEDHPPTAGLFSPAMRAEPLPEAARRNLVDRYDGEILYLDAELGRLFERLRQIGLLDRTLLVIVADHGETFYEHGMWGHGHSLFEEELRVPLAMILPGRIAAGARVDVPVRMVDLMPTFLDLLGVEGPPGMQGRSLVPLLAGEDASGRPVYSEIEWAGRRWDCLRQGRYKLIRGPGPEGPWLYDLDRDPGERENLAGRLPERTAAMLAEIERLRDAFERARLAREGGTGEIDETTRGRLRALGYVE